MLGAPASPRCGNGVLAGGPGVWHTSCDMKVLDSPQSGSRANVTASRNRYGQYFRTRATPVNPRSGFQGAVRARLSAASAGWRTLTSAQRAGWAALGLMLTRTDSLGQPYTLTGAQAYASVNNVQGAAGNAALTDAPALVTPEAVATLAVTLTASSFSLAYTPTPLPTGERLFVYLSPQRSAGRNYESDLRLTHVSAAAAASPANVLAAYTARFGVPIVGQRIFVECRRYKGGFLSGAYLTSAVVA
jgi:hypothetical protein